MLNYPIQTLKKNVVEAKLDDVLGDSICAANVNPAFGFFQKYIGDRKIREFLETKTV